MAELPTDPQWSKDGSLIVFSHPPAAVFVAQADGSRMWALPPGASMGTAPYPGNLSPALSPDGSRVAYAMIVKENHTTEIVTSAPDGSGLRKLTSYTALDAFPAWSPDGSRIASSSLLGPSAPLASAVRQAQVIQVVDSHALQSDGDAARPVRPR